MMTVNSTFLKEHRPAVLGFLRAVVEATNALNQDRNKYIDAAIKGTGSAPEVIREAIPHGKLDYKLYSKEAKALS